MLVEIYVISHSPENISSFLKMLLGAILVLLAWMFAKTTRQCKIHANAISISDRIKMKYWLLTILVLSGGAKAAGLNCSEALAMEDYFAKQLPMQVDEVTTVVEVSVNCTNRSIKYVKHLSIPVNILAEGFADRKQRQHNNIHCNGQGLARAGWTALDYVFDSDMTLIMKLKTTPEKCN